MWYDKYVGDLEAAERKYAPNNRSDADASKTSVKDILAKLRQSAPEQKNAQPNAPINVADDDDVAIALLYRKNLERAVDFCGETVHDLDATLTRLNSMIEKHRKACLTTDEVNYKCTRLLNESKRLESMASKIREPLSHFTELVKLGPKLGLPLRSPGDDENNFLDNDELLEIEYSSTSILKPNMKEFEEVLLQIQSAIAYLYRHLHYQEASLYITSYQKLEKRALGLMTFEITRRIIDVASQTDGSGNTGPVSSLPNADGTKQLESLPIYSKWKMEGSSLAKSISDLKAAKNIRQTVISKNDDGAHHDHYDPLFECEKIYFQYREPIILPMISATLEKWMETNQVNDLVRNGASYLLRILHLEYELYRDFFFGDEHVESRYVGANESDKDHMFENMADNFGNVLYDSARPVILSQHDVDSLCDLIHILKTEIIEGQLEGNRYNVHAMENITLQLLQDVQERLVYRVEKFILEEIELFDPKAADLNYPGKLEASSESVKADKWATSSSLTWYPTLDMTLMCLSKLYRCVDTDIFDCIAQQALSACTKTLLNAGNRIRGEKTQIDASLFLIKHLLILREQINPFDLHFSVTEQQLDFSTTANAFVMFLQRVSAWFSLENNAVFQFFYDGIPSVISNEIDAKRDVEQELKHACESFILHATNIAVKPLLDLLREHASASSNNGQQAKIKLPFPKAKEALKTASTSAAEEFGVLRKKLSLYLANASTEVILLKPALGNIQTAISRFQQCEMINTTADGDRILQTYYEKLIVTYK